MTKKRVGRVDIIYTDDQESSIYEINNLSLKNFILLGKLAESLSDSEKK